MGTISLCKICEAFVGFKGLTEYVVRKLGILKCCQLVGKRAEGLPAGDRAIPKYTLHTHRAIPRPQRIIEVLK